MSHRGEFSNNDIIGKLTLLASVYQCYFPVTSNLNMSQQGKVFIQRYYRNHNNLSLCRQVLLSGNFQFEHAATGERFKQRYCRNMNTLKLSRPVLLSDNVQSEHVGLGEWFQTTILSELNTLSLCRPVLLSGSVQSEKSQEGRVFKNDIIGTLTLKAYVVQCHFQVTSNQKHVAAVQKVQTTILSEP